MIDYFPGAYWPNLMLCNTIACGGTIGDVDDACREARSIAIQRRSADDPAVLDALYHGFTSVAGRLQGLVASDVARNYRRSASAKQFRATAMLLTMEFLLWDFLDPRKIKLFERYRASFRRAMELDPDRASDVKFLQVPFDGTVLDGMLVLPAKPAVRMPVVIHLNGTHSTMEWPYLTGCIQALAKRGIASFSFDHPGSGTARYHKGMKYRPDAEAYVSAAIDFLSGREDIDRSRIGVMGASFGGYHAPRAAAFEKRIKAVFCWGGMYEWGMTESEPEAVFIDDSPQGRIAAAYEPQLQSFFWQFGVKDRVGLYRAMKMFTLRGVIDRVTVPLYIVHGRNDQQLPLRHAEQTIREATRSAHAELLVIDADDGGAEHCNIDNPATALATLADWASESLAGDGSKQRI